MASPRDARSRPFGKDGSQTDGTPKCNRSNKSINAPHAPQVKRIRTTPAHLRRYADLAHIHVLLLCNGLASVAARADDGAAAAACCVEALALLDRMEAVQASTHALSAFMESEEAAR
jgi:hypothetical protein